MAKKYFTYSVGNRTWYLHKEKEFYYFRLKPNKHAISSLPKDRKVKVTKTGLPIVKKC